MEDLPPIIDPAVIAELSSVGGPRGAMLLHRVLDLFIGRAPEGVADVEKHAGGDDLEALANAAHGLKSMCASIGAKRAFGACHALETAARGGAPFDTGALTAAVSQELAAALSEAKALRAG